MPHNMWIFNESDTGVLIYLWFSVLMLNKNGFPCFLYFQTFQSNTCFQQYLSTPYILNPFSSFVFL